MLFLIIAAQIFSIYIFAPLLLGALVGFLYIKLYKKIFKCKKE